MSSWDNSGFEYDDSYKTPQNTQSITIPRVEITRDGNPNKSYSTTPNKKKKSAHNEIILSDVNESQENSDTEDEDYSLSSYFKKYAIYSFIKKASKYVVLTKLWRHRLKWFVIGGCVTVYVILMLLIHSTKEVEDYWCHGDGFVLFLTFVAVTGIAYFKVWKPYIWVHMECPVDVQLEKLKNWMKNNRYLKVVTAICVVVLAIGLLIWDTEGERERLISLLGTIIFLLFGFLFSKAPRKISWRQVIWGMSLQLALGLLILRWPPGEAIFDCLAGKVETFLKFTNEGSDFLFSYLSSGNKVLKLFPVFAFTVLPVVIFFSMFANILYYYGIMQWIVMKVGWLLQVTIGTTPCESMNASANIFLGMSEAPLIIKPYLPVMTKSELHAVMTGGFATIAGSVLAAYINFGVSSTHLLGASVMSAPAALAFSKLFYPETEKSKTGLNNLEIVKGTECNALHAALEGVSAAIPLIANIGANLLAFISFIAFVDAVLDWSCQNVGVGEGVCSLSTLFGYIFIPIAWIMGVPWEDTYEVAQLIGKKTFINEFVAYEALGEFQNNGTLSRRSEIIATYALCGFSNIGSIGIQLGALGAMAPSRKDDLAKIVTRAMIAGNIACFLTACVAVEAGHTFSIETTGFDITLSLINTSEYQRMLADGHGFQIPVRSE